jgi:hypothetical protein
MCKKIGKWDKVGLWQSQLIHFLQKNWPLSLKIGHNESNAGSRSESAFELECEDPLKRNRFVKHSQIKQNSTKSSK